MTTNLWIAEARVIAAQCWCEPETSMIEMDGRLAETFAQRLSAWMDTAAQNDRNAEYWRGRAQVAEMTIDMASRALSGENMTDQGEAFDVASRILAKINTKPVDM